MLDGVVALALALHACLLLATAIFLSFFPPGWMNVGVGFFLSFFFLTFAVAATYTYQCVSAATGHISATTCRYGCERR